MRRVVEQCKALADDGAVNASSESVAPRTIERLQASGMARANAAVRAQNARRPKSLVAARQTRSLATQLHNNAQHMARHHSTALPSFASWRSNYQYNDLPI